MTLSARFFFFLPAQHTHNFRSAWSGCLKRGTNISEGHGTKKGKTISLWMKHSSNSTGRPLGEGLSFGTIMRNGLPSSTQGLCFAIQNNLKSRSSFHKGQPIFLYYCSRQFFLYCYRTCEPHTSGLALDYLLGLSVTDTTVASCQTASIEKIKPIQSSYNSLRICSQK